MNSSKLIVSLMVLFASLLTFSSAAWAGGRVTYADGKPAAGANVVIVSEEGGKSVIRCDANGHFDLEGTMPAGAMVLIQAENQDYEPVRLPAGLFASGEVAIVLQAKRAN